MTDLEKMYRVPPEPLFRKDSDKPAAYFCVDCRAVVDIKFPCLSCGPYRCECGEIIEQRGAHRSHCKKCEDQRMLDRENQRHEKLMSAELTEPTEVIFCQKSERFYTWEDFDMDYEDHEKPERVWACREVRMSIDADDIVENATADMHDEAWDQVTDDQVCDLQMFLDDWCRETGITSWFPTKKAVLVNPGTDTVDE